MESFLQNGNLIYKTGKSVTKWDVHLQRGILGLQMGFSCCYSPSKIALLHKLFTEVLSYYKKSIIFGNILNNVSGATI